MDESVVYGCIKDVAFDNVAERRRVNREALQALPSAEGWPLISREMFCSMAPEVTETTFRTEVLHFGASYQGIEYEWKKWMEHFELLLRKMYWISAAVHLETETSGSHAFLWETNGEYHEPGSSDIQIRCEWVHEGWLSGG